MHSETGVVDQNGVIAQTLDITSDPGSGEHLANLYLDEVVNGEPQTIDSVQMRIEGTSGG